MPMAFTIDHDNQRIAVSATGVLLAHEMTDCMRSILRDGDWGESYSMLVDMTRVDRVEADYEEMRNVALTSELSARTRRRTGRHAIVAATDANFGMARMFQTMVEEKVPRQVMTFRNIEDEREWLDEPRFSNPAKKPVPRIDGA